MKPATGQINGLLEKPPASLRAVLIYGPDAGLVRERADTLARKIAPADDPFRTAMLTVSAIGEDPARLYDEMAAQALGGGRRLIRIQSATDGIAGALAGLLSSPPPGDSFLLIEAGELEKRSKLRSLCENEADIAAAIACYVGEGPARMRMIGEILQTNSLRANRDVIAFLADILPPDRMAMRSELDKLALYCVREPSAPDAASAATGPALTVTIEDVMAVVQDAGAAEIDDLVNAVGAGDKQKAVTLITRLFAEQTSAVAVVRAAQRHFMRLQFARGEMDKGASADSAMMKLQPPVFWKYKDSMGAQLRRWNGPRLERALDRLYETEAALKRTGSPDEILCAQLLLQMAAV